jgi:hypothetical protein
MSAPPYFTTEEDLEWWLDLAPSLPWHFASSMPDAPHSYVVRGRTLDEERFMRAVHVIRTFGQPGKFWSRTNVYLTVGQVKWWTMGDTLDGTIIINMANTEKVYGRQDAPLTRSGIPMVYDGLACDYDSRYLSPDCIEENEHMAAIVRKHFGAYAPRTLDVGCGTGLLLDLGITAPGMFVGVDPSQGMLNELIRKHPRIRNIHAARMEDVIEIFAPKEFELVTAWFGAASYIDPTVIEMMPKLASSLLILMNSRDGYLPDYYGDLTWDTIEEPIEESLAAARELPGAERFVLGHFEVTVLRV